MTVRQPRYSKEEFARRGDEIYESQVRAQVEDGNHGRIAAGSFAVPKATTSKPETLKLMRVKSLPAIASKPVTQTLKSGLSALVPVMFVDLADARREPYNHREHQRRF